MTDHRPSGPVRPFGPDELEGVSGMAPDDALGATRVARTLEDVAARGSVRPSSDFTDRVMAAVALEPAAAPVRAAGTALRHGAFGAFLASVRDAWRVTFSPAFPLVARAQAIALVLVIAGLTTGGGLATAGALGLLDGNPPSPDPSTVVPSPSVEPSPSPMVTPSESPSPSPSPSMDDETAEPSGSPEPSESPEDESTEPSDDAGASSGSKASPAPTQRPSPTRTPSPTETPSDDDEPSDPPGTPKPSRTPDPSPTPDD